VIELRPARPDEAGSLTELALRSKGHWGYDPDLMDKFRLVLALTPQDITRRRVVLAESAGRVLGFRSLDGEPPVGELGNLWVEPAAIGTGIGRLLWTDALNSARAAGFAALTVEADPHAEGFYLTMGARRTGVSESTAIPGRMLPLLRIELVGGNLADPRHNAGD
jgi:GNAT superfamily N-acetyltransferase